MNPIVKPWPFRGWGLDFIGEIHHGPSKGHRFILVATDYFTKWAEAVPLRNMTHREVISFMQEHIMYRFGVPQTLTTDQGPSFMSYQFREFAESLKIKLLNSSPYYVQANGQAEASNKVLIKIIKKRIKHNPRKWHEKLSEALWVHRRSRHGATKVTLFELVYGQEVVLPVEMNLQNLMINGQDYLSAKEYTELIRRSPWKPTQSFGGNREGEGKDSQGIQQTCNGKIISSGRSSMENDFTVGDSKW
jgi:hypothetical protein